MWNILVVDDHRSDRKVITRNLRGRAVCVEAADGNEALAAIRKSLDDDDPFDAVLLDVMMPRMSGNEVLKIISELEADRGIARGHGVPVIMVTGSRPSPEKPFEKGSDDYLMKPIVIRELVEKLEHWIKTRPQKPPAAA